MTELSYARELYYRGSGRVPLGRLAVAALAVTAAAAGAGAVYAVIIANVARLGDMLYVAAAAPLVLAAFAFGAGGATGGILKRARVHNPLLWWVVAVWGALCAWYVSWVVWEFIVLRRFGLDVPFLRLLTSPRGDWYVALLINRVGTVAFGRGDTPLAGSLLWVLWAIEAAAVLGVASWLPFKMLRLLAFCEGSGRWCVYRQGQLSVGYGAGDNGDVGDLRGRLEQKDLSVLEEYGKADMDAPRRFRIDLQHCPGCGQTHLMSVFLIRVTEYTNGRTKDKARRVIDRLWLDPAQAEQVNGFKNRLWPPIAAVAVVPAEENDFDGETSDVGG